ncbi:uncharacterized protein LOC131854122 [Achroia grisella]|uniref:uncharacterized protein LOC131854122 n=1 Tax=Achroia grisella TaxID=688607 RepID=UPI0027D2C510|nr:uncharacterized protein LOC131854122 [Achroia grisella]
MIVQDCDKMPCESCAVQFSVFRRKRACCECERYYCSGCLRRGGGAMCAPCRVLSTRPLSRQTIAHLKVRDIQCFLQRQNVSTRGCVEKEELVSLCVSHVNSAAYRRRGSRSGSSPFSTLKGFTNNINVLINNAFDLRSTPQPAPPSPHSECYNSSHVHTATSRPAPNPPPDPPQPAPRTLQRERFTTTPGGERDIRVPVPEPRAEEAAEGTTAHSADCYEIEDVDDGWEVVARPADPLPNDSEVLITESDDLDHPAERMERAEHAAGAGPGAGPGARARAVPARLAACGGSPQRAASELELRPPAHRADTASLQDEPLMDTGSGEESERAECGGGGGGGGGGRGAGGRVSLGALRAEAELEALNVRQLKELLARNRVEYRGCLERADLLERAKMLWREHHHYADDIDKLPMEECCKICMAAPLECVLLECGHMAACTACSKQLAECPICRQYVVRAVRVFRS